MNEENLYSLRAEPSPQFANELWQRLPAQPAAEKRPSRAPRLAMGLAVAVAAVGLLAWTPVTRAAIDGVLSETAGVRFWESDTIGPVPVTDDTAPYVHLTEQKLTFDEAVAQITGSMIRPPATLGDYTAADPYGVIGVGDDGTVRSYSFLYYGPETLSPPSGDKPGSVGSATISLSADTNPGVWLTGVDSVREVTVGDHEAAIVQGGWTSGSGDPLANDVSSGYDPNVKIWSPDVESIALVWQQDGVQYTLSGSTTSLTADTLAQIAGEIE
jgi:hypothetical protein